MKIMPYIGYGITFFGEVSNKKNKDEVTKGSTFFGLNVGFKNRKRVNFSPSFFKIKEEGNSFIRARIFINQPVVHYDLS